MVPADDQAMALPCASVMVIMVLLNVALTCATPEAIFLRSRLRTRASLPIINPFTDQHRKPTPSLSSAQAANRPPRELFLLAGNRLRRTLASAGVGVGALSADRQSTTMTQP